MVYCACGVGMTGEFYYEDREFERARDAFEQAAAERPNDPVVNYWLGKSYAELGQFAQMRSAWDRSLAHSLRYAEEIEGLLKTYWTQQQVEATSRLEAAEFSGGLTALRNALIIQPDDTQSLQGLAYVYMQVDSVAQAQRVYERLVRDPANRDAYEALGWIHMDAGRFEKAVGYLEHLVDIDPFDLDALNHLGLAYEQLERYPQAVDICEQLVAMAPDEVPIWLRLGTLYENEEEPERAGFAYEEALRLESANVEVVTRLAQFRVKQGDDEAALPLLELLTVLQAPPAQAVWLQLARIYQLRGLEQKGRQAAQAAQAVEP
jgi:tetratricopeptide (TPR) repeat protein